MKSHKHNVKSHRNHIEPYGNQTKSAKTNETKYSHMKNNIKSYKKQYKSYGKKHNKTVFYARRAVPTSLP